MKFLLQFYCIHSFFEEILMLKNGWIEVVCEAFACELYHFGTINGSKMA